MTDCIDELEAYPGLPEELPPGETVLWQGAPDWRMVARHTFHLRLLAGYFLLLLILSSGLALFQGGGLQGVLLSASALVVPGLLVGGLFALGAWLIARTTLYTVTSRRLVMRFGIALPLCINLPFSRIRAASVKSFAHGFGDIPLTVEGSHRVSYVVMWPHVRPWQFRNPEPMLRGIPDARAVAELIAGTASTPEPVSSDRKRSPDTDVPVPAKAQPATAIRQGG